MPFSKGNIPWNINTKGIMKANNTSFKKGERVSVNSEFKKGQTPWNKGKTKFDDPLVMKYSMAKVGRKRHDISGKNCHLWKGGISIQNRNIRMNIMSTIQYKTWRWAVFQRDNFTCIKCGERGKEIQADHIKPFALYPELRFVVDNGRTLCIPCHKNTGTWGRSSAPKMEAICK